MQLVHVVAGDEALDFDDVGALEGHLVELVLVQRDVAALGYLVAFDPILLRHLLAGLRIDHLVTNPMPGVVVAGNKATLQVTSESLRYPFQFGRRSMAKSIRQNKEVELTTKHRGSAPVPRTTCHVCRILTLVRGLP